MAGSVLRVAAPRRALSSVSDIELELLEGGCIPATRWAAAAVAEAGGAPSTLLRRACCSAAGNPRGTIGAWSTGGSV